MSWGGYIPGSLLREIIEKEEAKLFAEIDKPALQQKIADIITEECVAYSDGCCGGAWIEFQNDAAREIVKLIESLLTSNKETDK